MYRVLLFLPLHYANGDKLSLEKEVELPFPPYPGLFIEKSPNTDLNVQMDSVCWIQNENRFRAFCFPQRLVLNKAEAMEVAIQEGWRNRNL